MLDKIYLCKNPKYAHDTLHISALCGPDDGRVTTETCCRNEFI